jgi:hypothetical protein
VLNLTIISLLNPNRPRSPSAEEWHKPGIDQLPVIWVDARPLIAILNRFLAEYGTAEIREFVMVNNRIVVVVRGA